MEPVTKQPGDDHNFSDLAQPRVHGQEDVVIKRMTAADATFVGAMTVESFRSKFEWAVGKNNIDKAKALQGKVHASIADMDHNIFVAWYQEERAGVVAIQYPGDRDEDGDADYCRELGCLPACGLWCMACAVKESSIEKGTCYIDHICVDSGFRGRGIGRVLMEKADYEARQKGCRSITLWVAQDNRARNLYERQGYHIIKDEDGACITYCAVGVRKFYEMEKNL